MCWLEMGMTFEVLRLQNLLYLKNELMKWADFFHADKNLEKLKVLGQNLVPEILTKMLLANQNARFLTRLS